MTRRYRELDICGDISSKMGLISVNNHRHAIAKILGDERLYSGDIHYLPGNSRHFFIVDWKDKGRRMGIRYNLLEKLFVEIIGGSYENFSRTAKNRVLK